ncbi:MAG: sugar porter family MFS transporter, partial [Paludibacter sp.]
MKTQKNSFYPVFISVIAALGGLLFAIDAAIISGVVPFLKIEFEMSGSQIGMLVSSLVLGCIVGVVYSGTPADKFGRVNTLKLSALLFGIGAMGSAWSNSETLFIVFRMIAGFSVGISSMVSPMYIAEVSPAKRRGQLVSLFQFTIVLGSLMGYLSNYWLVSIGDVSWRIMMSVMLIPTLIFMIGLFFVPESPRWLIQNNQLGKAKFFLEKLNSPEEAALEIQSIQRSLGNKTETNFKTVFEKKYRLPLFIGISMAVLQQVTGINAIMYYAPIIFEKSGLSIDSAIQQTIMVGVINLTFTIVALFYVDKLGRRPLLIGGSTIMALSLATVYASFIFTLPSIVTLLAILMFIAAFACSMGPLTWVVISELFPNSIRGKAMSISIVFLWIACFFVALLFPLLIDNVGIANTFLVFTFFSIIGVFFILKFIKETKGKE